MAVVGGNLIFWTVDQRQSEKYPQVGLLFSSGLVIIGLSVAGSAYALLRPCAPPRVGPKLKRIAVVAPVVAVLIPWAVIMLFFGGAGDSTEMVLNIAAAVWAVASLLAVLLCALMIVWPSARDPRA
jgi:hypothetical protein